MKLNELRELLSEIDEDLHKEVYLSVDGTERPLVDLRLETEMSRVRLVS
jgi:hypothetical protein